MTADLSRLKLNLDERVALGLRVRELRVAASMSTLQLAEEVLGYDGSHAAVSRLERGVLASIRMDQVSRIAARFGVTLGQLLGHEPLTDEQEQDGQALEFNGIYRQSDVAPGLGRRFTSLRQAAGLTRAQLAAALGWSPHGVAVIQGWERGEVTPRVETLLNVAAVLGVSGSRLITGKARQVACPNPAVRMRALRIARGVSRPQMAYRADPEDFSIVHSAIHQMESCNRIPDAITLEKIAKALDVPAHFLAAGAENEARYRQETAQTAPAAAQRLWDEEQQLSGPQRDHLSLLRALMATGQLEGEKLLALSRFVARLCWSRRQAARQAA